MASATYRKRCCKRCARLTKALESAPESLQFQESQQFGVHTCTVKGLNMHGNPTARRTQPSLPVSGTGSLRETTRLQGQVTSPSLRSKAYAVRVKTCAWRNTAHLHPRCARRTSLRALDSLDKAQHQLSPPKLRVPIPCNTSYNTILPSYTPLPGVMTALALQTSLILVVEFHAVCRCTMIGA